MPSLNRTFSLLVLLVLFAALPGFAQQNTGSIYGSVIDPTGAAVPGAQVTLQSLDTGYNRQVATGGAGDYFATPLPVGIYEVTVTKAGFQSQVHTNLTLQLQQRLEVDFTLQLGKSTQTVEVTGAANLLQVNDASIGEVVTNQQINELPLNGRNIYQLVALTPGVTTAPDAMPIIGGQIGQQQVYVLDGLNNINYQGSTNSGGMWNIAPAPDAVQEFKVQTNNYSAEFGTGQGVINVVTKGGTNQIHGSLYEFLRNEVFDGRDFFSPSKPRYIQNQFGGSLGGPIVIPHVFDGHKRTFFFLDYEGFRTRQGTTQNVVLPSLAERGGNFSDLLTGQTFTDPCTGAVYDLGQIFDPNTTHAATCLNGSTGFARTPVPGNVLSSSQIVAPATNTLALVPLPNSPGSRYIWNPPLRNDFNQLDINLDHQWGSHDHIAGRYSFRDVPPGGIPDFPGPAAQGVQTLDRQQRVSFEDTHIISPTVVNEFHVGYIRNAYQSRLIDTTLNPSSLGFQNVPYIPGIVGGPPEISITGVAGIGAAGFTPTLTTARNQMLYDTLSFVRGKHSFKIGGDVYSWWTTQFESTAAAAEYGFTGILTADLNAPSSISGAAAVGSPLAQFMFGIPNSAVLSNTILSDDGRKAGALFVQDDWKATEKLTVNLGLRWDFGNSDHERFNRVTNIDFSNGDYVMPASRQNMAPQLPTGFPVEWSKSNSLFAADNKNVGPRVGLAYRLTPKTVIRSGFGLFYMNLDQATYTIDLPLNPPWESDIDLYAPPTGPIDPVTGNVVVPVTSMVTGFPADAFNNPNLVSQSLLFPVTPKPITPYTVNWNFTIQREFTPNLTLEAAYSATHGNHLWVGVDANQPYPTANPNSSIQSRRPFPNLGSAAYSQTEAVSNYNALEVKIEKRYSHGLTFMGGYTWSHALDDAPQATALANTGSGGNDDVRNARNLRQEYGNAGFNTTHRFVMSWLYALPFGHGRAFGANWHGALERAAGGWEIGGIATLQSGFWFTPGTYVDPANAPAYFDPARPNEVGKPKDFSYGTSTQAAYGCPTGRQSIQCFFNPAAFTYADPGAFGNAGRNIVEGPGFTGFDFTVHKDFAFDEGKKRFEFRAEVFNILNTPNFRVPDNEYEDPSFGALLSTDHNPREIQFSLDFKF
jgi:hypothetical protein